MAWFQLIYLQCDADGCTNGHLGKTHGEGMRVTREKATHQGWRVWEGRDYCPAHAATGIPRTRVRALTDNERVLSEYPEETV